MVDLISEITRLNQKCNKLESENLLFKQEVSNMLYDMRNLGDSDSLSIPLVREMIESLLDEEEVLR